MAKNKGISGTVIDGVCRDVPAILNEKYPVFSRGRFIMTGKDRGKLEACHVTVPIGQRQVKPGDILIGDDSRVVAVPREPAPRILETAHAIETAENSIVKAVQAGLSLRKARERFGYHALQTRKDRDGRR